MAYSDEIMCTDHSVTDGDGPAVDDNDADTDPDTEVIRASGCVVYRHGINGPAVLVVHRPRYDDWDLPKGKRERGETDEECAVRETEEESGFHGRLERELEPDRYRVRGREKTVRWFLMECTGGTFQPNEEVDRIRWLSPGQAREILSYGHARALVDAVPGQMPEHDVGSNARTEDG